MKIKIKKTKSEDKIELLRLKSRNFLDIDNPSKMVLDEMLRIINHCSNIYYDGIEDSPLLDEEYDKVVNHYKKFRDLPLTVQPIEVNKKKKNKNLIDTQHMFPELVGTLTKTNYVYNKDREEAKNPDTETVEDWLNGNISFFNKKDKYEFIQTWKIDGNSITISYNDKRQVILALTRGKNGLGSDKTNYFINRSLPKWFPIEKGDVVGIKYEVVTSYANKAKIEEIIGKTYASPCSLVAGLLNKNDTPQEVIDLITLVPINIQYKNHKITRQRAIELICMLHNKESEEYPISILPDPRNYNIEKAKYSDIVTSVEKMYKYFIDRRGSLAFPVDGLVFEFVDDKVRTTMGRIDDKNMYEFALKFPYSTKRSHVKDIEFYTSTNGTGRITPVVIFDDVQFSRAVCNHVSIANYKRFKELKLAKGDEVIISYRNETLAYLTLPEDYEHVGKPIKFITKCPYCGEPLKVNKEKTFVRCANKNCPAIKIGKFNNYLIKIGVDNVRENILADLYNAGLLKGLSSLYKLSIADIIRIDGYKETSAKNIIDNINAKKEVFDYELLGALGFKNISTSTCKEICKVFSLSELKAIANDEFDNLSLQLLDVNGVAEITANQFEKDFTRSLKTIENLEKYLTVKELKNTVNKSSDPKSIVFTGFRDKTLQDKLEMAGHSVKSSVSGKTNIVVTAHKGSGSIKEKKAEELGIPVYSLDEFRNKILSTLVL